jgi:hypothetical protein
MDFVFMSLPEPQNKTKTKYRPRQTPCLMQPLQNPPLCSITVYYTRMGRGKRIMKREAGIRKVREERLYRSD